ncbi:MAG: hypothetical protein C0459_03835 [Chitinophaga sp.]|jgi:Domain of Unknown Function with PDB structure (DUF3858)/Transglutaminase-like superfamily/Domain of Unknown Function with PDB structure (DUF3857)|nr:hypothetical protein [Chitinophaga sp.]
MRKLLLAALVLLTTQMYSFAQKNKEVKFGDIKPSDFTVNSPVVKDDDPAVYLFDIGSTNIDGNNNGYFTLIFKKHVKLLIRNKNAFDLGTIKETIFKGLLVPEEEKFEDFEAATYNLENGQIAITKLDKSAILTEKNDKIRVTKKFTFPNLKEGSIVEYTYTIKSPFIYFREYMRGWNFQGKYPILWSEYQVTIPPMFNYAKLMKGIQQQFAIDSSKTIFKTYSVVESNGVSSSDYYHFSGDAVWHLWAIKDVPAFKTEGFVSSYKNYLTRVQFQLINIKFCESCRTQQIMKGWYDKVNDLMKDENFGLELTQDNRWLNDDIQKITGTTSGVEAAKKIYEYIRDKFTCTDYDATALSSPLKKTYQSKTGNVADINILLTAMLKNAGFEALPAILSTRDNGFVDEAMPLMNQYNYVLCNVKIDDKSYLLDASQNKLGFGKLTEDCYNGSARLIDKSSPLLVPLVPDSLIEQKTTSVFITNNDAGKPEASVTSTLGYNESFEVRDKIKKIKPDEIFAEIKKAYPFTVTLNNTTLDSLNSLDDPISIKYEMKMDLGDEDIIYFSPMLTEATRNNPFKSVERNYPVEFPYVQRENYILNMEIPKGYKVDELPKSTRVKLNDNEGMFEYIIRAEGENIQLMSRLILNKATYSPEDYATLRDFYAFIIKKEAEQIVFKKVK